MSRDVRPIVCRVLNVIARDPDLGPVYARMVGAPEGPHRLTATQSACMDALAHRIEDAIKEASDVPQR